MAHRVVYICKNEERAQNKNAWIFFHVVTPYSGCCCGAERAAEHLRQWVREAKLRSLHCEQNQSPGLMPRTEAVLRGELHCRHELREAKLRWAQLGQCQSPGLMLEGSWAWTYIMRMAGSMPAGCGVEHLRQAVREAKLRSWQVGQNQSPGLVPMVGSEKGG